MEYMKKLNKGLENKIISLQMKIEEMKKEMKNASQELMEIKLKYDISRNKEIELKNKFESERMVLINMIKELQKEKCDIEKKVIEKENVIKEQEAKCSEVEMERNKLVMEIEKIKNTATESKIGAEGLNNARSNKTDLMSTSVISNIINTELPLCRKKDREYMGIFEFKKDDTKMILTRLVLDLKPSTAKSLLPGLPASIVFMCIRQTDISNDENGARRLLKNYTHAVRETVKKYEKDLDRCILWLSNTVRLLNTLKQYSRDPAYHKENTEHQNKQCLQNFDLVDYRQELNDVAIWIYKNYVVRQMQESIQEMFLFATLEIEQSSSNVISLTPDALQEQLTNFYETLCLHGVDMSLINQVFKQLYYFIFATTMNDLLQMKVSSDSPRMRLLGKKIRNNVARLEQWIRKQNIQSTLLMDTSIQPVNFLFNPSNIRLEEIDIPEVLNLPMLRKI